MEGVTVQLRKTPLHLKMAKAEMEIGGSQPAFMGRWEGLRLREAGKETQQSVRVGKIVCQIPVPQPPADLRGERLCLGHQEWTGSFW